MTQPKVVLIAEDDVLVRIVAVEILTDAGFAVFEANHAAEALEILHIRAADIHMLFTDINMPGSLNGLQLAHRVFGAWPDIALLITSGAQNSPLASDLPTGCRFLPKPYLPRQVMAHVGILLAA